MKNAGCECKEYTFSFYTYGMKIIPAVLLKPESSTLARGGIERCWKELVIFLTDPKR